MRTTLFSHVSPLFSLAASLSFCVERRLDTGGVWGFNSAHQQVSDSLEFAETDGKLPAVSTSAGESVCIGKNFAYHYLAH
jgi:hypothetical protein